MPLPASLVALSAAAAIAAGLAVRGHYTGPRRTLVYVFKPLATLLILAIALRQGSGGRYALLVALGLLFSLAGDVFLMLPRDRFREGLASFLVAHLCYIAAFAWGTGLLADPVLAVAFGALGLLLLRVLWPGIPRRLRAPVALYVAVILAMALQAAGRAMRLHDVPSLLAAAGAALFVVSDALLSWDRFRASFRSSRAAVLSTYFLAQWLIALSVPDAPSPISWSKEPPGRPGAEVADADLSAGPSCGDPRVGPGGVARAGGGRGRDTPCHLHLLESGVLGPLQGVDVGREGADARRHVPGDPLLPEQRPVLEDLLQRDAASRGLEAGLGRRGVG